MDAMAVGGFWIEARLAAIDGISGAMTSSISQI
jgi:hypothetical protein